MILLSLVKDDVRGPLPELLPGRANGIDRMVSEMALRSSTDSFPNADQTDWMNIIMDQAGVKRTLIY